eukprot:COSAG02_NODE_1951_length_10286_cov_4.096005_3_plen_182_part_00
MCCFVLFRPDISPQPRRRLTTTGRFSKATSHLPQRQSVCQHQLRSRALQQKQSSGMRPSKHWSVAIRTSTERVSVALALCSNSCARLRHSDELCALSGLGGDCRQALTANALGVLLLACTMRLMRTSLTRLRARLRPSGLPRRTPNLLQKKPSIELRWRRHARLLVCCGYTAQFWICYAGD